MKNVRKKDESVSLPTIVAVAKEQERLFAAKVCKDGDDFEILWTKDSLSLNNEFVSDGDQQVMVFDSAGVIFYRIKIPQAETGVFSKMVRVQAESKLPLSADEIELTWRADREIDGQIPVTIAATRKSLLGNFINDISPLTPEKIILDYEAIAKVWRKCFGGNDSVAIVLSVSENCTKVCMVEEGLLIRAVNLNIGGELFLADGSTAARRFAQDVAGTVEMFGFENTKEVPVFLLTDGRTGINDMTDCLCSAGFRAVAVLPEGGDLNVYEYRVAIGAAMVAFDSEQKRLNIFKDIYAGKGKKKKNSQLSFKVACVVCVAVAVLFVIMLYITDTISLSRIERKLSRPDVQADFQVLMEKQGLKKQVALSRPNFLKLLQDISGSGKEGIKLTGFDFKRAQKITITGIAGQDKQLYEFQKKLQSEKYISDVKIQSADKDSKSNKINFIINFHYRNFTKKGLESLVF